MNNNNDLRLGAGANGPLKPKGNFERCPHRRQLLHLSSVYQSSSGYYREALRPVIRTLLDRLEATCGV